MEETYNSILLTFIASIYPFISIYNYFVIIGIYCIDDHNFKGITDLLIFIIYHAIILYIMLFYMRITNTEEMSTISKFPNMRITKEERDFSDLNIFIKNDIIKKKVQNINICNICKTYKPPRAHHCKVCNKCFLKMYNHCYILGVCIAFHNYKFFHLFIYNNFISFLFLLIVMISELIVGGSETKFLVHYIITTVIGIISLIYTIYFLRLNIFLINYNETTIEHRALNEILKGDTSRTYVFQEGLITSMVDVKDRKVLNPYNLGKELNLRQVLGENRLDWIIPTFSSLGDGVSFPKNYKDSGHELV